LNRPNVLVLGIGNILLSDEGVGIHVIQELQKRPLPENVTVLDGGTTGFELVRFFEGMHKVILVDAVKTNLEIGAVVRLTPAEIEDDLFIPFSVHQSGINSILSQAKSYYPSVQVVIFGVVIEEPGEFNLQLSEPIEAAVPQVVEKIIAEFENG